MVLREHNIDLGNTMVCFLISKNLLSWLDGICEYVSLTLASDLKFSFYPGKFNHRHRKQWIDRMQTTLDRTLFDSIKR